MRFIKWISLFSIMLALSGCHSISEWNSAQKRKAYEAGKDTCGRRYIEPYIGTDYDAINAREVLPERYTMRDIDDRDVLPPGSDGWVLTTDLKLTRVDIYIDKNGVLEKLECS